MRWLALDVGRVRVGVAVSDGEGRVVTPLPPLLFAGPDALADAVAALVREREVGGVAIGVPVTKSGEGRGERRVAAVLAALRARLAVPVETVDERGTTVAAQALLREAGVPPRRWDSVIDGLAARLILESFLTIQARKTK
jgi:putative holliday junction resolvase